VLGLDYYAHCQWDFSIEGGTAPSPTPIPFADLIQQYHDRYRLPCMVTETNQIGATSDRATWLKYVLEQCETAVERGVPIEALCWFPFIDSTDWNSLLFRCRRSIDPVGVYWLDEDFERHPSVMSAAYSAAALGATSAELLAYTLEEPVGTWLRGYLPQMAHWSWQSPPPENRGHSLPLPATTMELKVADAN
jgi:hypothetical protein